MSRTNNPFHQLTAATTWFICLALVGCGDTSKKSPSITPEQEWQQQSDSLKKLVDGPNTLQLEDTFTTSEAKPITADEISAMRPDYCAKRKGTKPEDSSLEYFPYILDPGLKVGSEVTTQFSSLRPSGANAGVFTTTLSSRKEKVAQVEANSVTRDHTMLYFKNENFEIKNFSPYFTSEPHYTDKYTYTFDSERLRSWPKSKVESIHSNFKEGSLPGIPLNRNWYCSVEYKSDQKYITKSVWQQEAVNLTFGQQKVKGILTTAVSPGEVVCELEERNGDEPSKSLGKVSLGEGYSEFIRASSFAMVSEDILDCESGTELYSKRSIKLSSGKTVDSWISQVQSAPLR